MAGMLGFITEGCREIGRKANRLGLRRRLVARDRDRLQALTRLGQTAWQSKVDLSAFAELRSHLEQLDARAGDLSATATRLEAERTDLQAQRQQELDRFEALLVPAKAAQSEADIALRAARAALADKDRAIRTIETQLASIDKNLSATGSSDPERREQIDAQHKALAGQAAAETAARAALATNVDTRAAESQRHAAETVRLDAERKAALQPIDAELDRLRQASAAASQDRASVGRDQDERFRDLGAALYERHSADPALTECVQAVAAIDAERSTTQAAIDASTGQTSAMPRGTMAKFATAVVLVPALLIAAAYGVYGRLESAAVVREAPRTPSTVTVNANAERDRIAADERQKDEAVQAFMKARTDPSLRKAGIEILQADVTALGSSADRSSLLVLLTILERGEPELRAAAANAVGMIGPTATEAPVLVKALNDPMPAVRDAVLQVLGRMSDPGARLLAERVRAGARDRPRSASDGFTPTVAPDTARLGTPLYAGATFLAFASDLEIGRVAFSTVDPVQKVVDFYAAAAAGRPPVNGQEFTRLYFGGSPSDPTGADAMNGQLQAWLKQAVAAGMPPNEMEAEYVKRVERMRTLPLVRYAEATLYGDPVFIALDVAGSEGVPRVARYVVVFKDHSLGRTGFEYHVAADTIRK